MSATQVYLQVAQRTKAGSNTRSAVKGESGKVKGESSCKRMGGNLFTHAMSEAEVQAHEVRLKVESERLKRSS